MYCSQSEYFLNKRRIGRLSKKNVHIILVNSVVITFILLKFK